MRTVASGSSAEAVSGQAAKVFVYDEGRTSLFTSFAGTPENHLIALAGGKNIFSNLQGAYSSVSWAAVASAIKKLLLAFDSGPPEL